MLPSGAAMGAGVSTFGVARWLNGPLWISGPNGVTAVPVGAVILASLVGVVGTVVLVRVASRARRPRRVFLMLVGAGLLISSLPPIQAATSASTTLWLLLLHIAVAAPLIPAGLHHLPGAELVEQQQ